MYVYILSIYILFLYYIYILDYMYIMLYYIYYIIFLYYIYYITLYSIRNVSVVIDEAPQPEISSERGWK